LRILAPRLIAALGVILAILAVALVAHPSPAAAHPLGNFTINHYDRIDVSESGIEVFSVLDMAEIPTFRERQQIDVNGDAVVDGAEAATYATSKAEEVRGNLTLTVNDEKAQLRETAHELTFPPGQGGLSLLRLTATYRATLPDGWRNSPPKVEFADTNYSDRLGWREIVVLPGAGVQLDGSTVPAEDATAELTMYPLNSLSSPLDIRSASFSFEPGAGIAPAPVPDRTVRATRGNPDSTLSRFANLIGKRDLSFGVIVLSLLAAAVFGAFHALSPGHGKTIVGAYLVGSRGTAKHALLLGLVVTATHTSTVYAVGFITLYLERFILPEDLYPWLSVASGALILSMGFALFVARSRSVGLWSNVRRVASSRLATSRSASSRDAPQGLALAFAASESAAKTIQEVRPISMESTQDGGAPATGGVGPAAAAHHYHEPPDGGDQHAHGGEAHSHGFGSHTHTLPGTDGEPVSWRSLIGLGIFGGLLPCPTAIVVMLSAISLHRVGFGLVLIVAFSVGLATVLTSIGFALVFARTLPERMPLLRRLGQRANGRVAGFAITAIPVASALAVVLAGVVVTLRALSQQGIL